MEQPQSLLLCLDYRCLNLSGARFGGILKAMCRRFLFDRPGENHIPAFQIDHAHAGLIVGSCIALRKSLKRKIGLRFIGRDREREMPLFQRGCQKHIESPIRIDKKPRIQGNYRIILSVDRAGGEKPGKDKGFHAGIFRCHAPPDKVGF
jgi:hypothetical protein